MAETVTDLRELPRAAAYSEVKEQMRLVLDGIDDPITGMATLAALLHGGSLGCLEIPFGKGVCGLAAAERRTVIVDDVNEFPGHITCDARARSEIVVPVFGPSGQLTAVLDIDSDETGAFSDDDRVGLEEIVQWFRTAAG